MGKPPREAGTAIDGKPNMAENKRQVRLEEVKLRKAGGARKVRKPPMATLKGALGAGANTPRKDGLVSVQTELPWSGIHTVRGGGQTGHSLTTECRMLQASLDQWPAQRGF